MIHITAKTVHSLWFSRPPGSKFPIDIEYGDILGVKPRQQKSLNTSSFSLIIAGYFFPLTAAVNIPWAQTPGLVIDNSNIPWGQKPRLVIDNPNLEAWIPFLSCAYTKFIRDSYSNAEIPIRSNSLERSLACSCNIYVAITRWSQWWPSLVFINDLH